VLIGGNGPKTLALAGEIADLAVQAKRGGGVGGSHGPSQLHRSPAHHKVRQRPRGARAAAVVERGPGGGDRLAMAKVHLQERGEERDVIGLALHLRLRQRAFEGFQRSLGIAALDLQSRQQDRPGRVLGHQPDAFPQQILRVGGASLLECQDDERLAGRHVSRIGLQGVAIARDGRIGAIDRGMLDSQWVAQQIGRPVIKAFNNIFAKSLLEKGLPRGTKGRIALPVAGDSWDAKAAVLRLVDDLGFDPVDGGDLGNSWRQQPGTPAYCQDLETAALRRALTEADRSRIADYRAEQEARIRQFIAAQTAEG